MKYHIWTEGCQMNVADSRRVASALEGLGYQPTASPEEADVIVLNTCVVRQSAEDKAYGRLTSLRPLKERRPEVVLNLMGCLVGVGGSNRLRQRFPYVDVFSPPSDPTPLLNHLARADGRSQVEGETEALRRLLDGEPVLPQAERGRLVAAPVPVVLGCSRACAFCIIPLRRGGERSRPEEQVVAEVRSLVSQGVREVTLLGQIVDRYGKDLPDGPNLADLLRRLHEIPELERIRFLTSHPSWFSDELLEAVADLPKVCEHLEIPVQAGDDAVLAAMRRGYTADDYRRLVERIRRRLPQAGIATDVIVGFPGESRGQFQRTYDLLAELRLDVAHLARYSPRPGTFSARRMADDVPGAEKTARFRALEDLQASIAGEINAALLGRTVEVLVEDAYRGRWKGRTRTNKLVIFDIPAKPGLPDGTVSGFRGRLVEVLVEWTGPWSLVGRLAGGCAR